MSPDPLRGRRPVPTRRIADRMRRLLAAGHHMRINQALIGAANRYLRAVYNEQQWDIEINGEAWLIAALSDEFGAAPIVFDVGANVGDYTRTVKRLMPGSLVHCFEILPATRHALRENLAELSGITIADRGLSSAAGNIKVGLDRENSTQAIAWDEGIAYKFDAVADCRVETGDNYLRENAVEHIDLLKIDTEGHEMAVLEGFAGALETRNIRCIQFEYGSTWLASHRVLYEAHALLRRHGFAFGRLFPAGVYFRDYDWAADEHFRMGNYVAVHRDDSLLRKINNNRGFAAA